MPLAATLATAGVFDAFGGAAKTDALLHGHSYSGHAIGLSAAAAALAIFDDPAANPALCAPAHLRADRNAALGARESVSSCVQAAAAVVGGRELDAAEAAQHSQAGGCVEAVAAVAGGGEASTSAARGGRQPVGGAGGLGLGAQGVGCACERPCGRLVELWDPAATAALSMRPDVARVAAIGGRPTTKIIMHAAGQPRRSWPCELHGPVAVLLMHAAK